VTAQSRWSDGRPDDLAAGLRRDFEALREEFRLFRTEMRAEFADFRTEMRAEFADFRGEMREEFAAFRSEMRADLREVQRWQLRLSAVTLLAIATVAVEVALR
jgi:hypothetical protein